MYAQFTRHQAVEMYRSIRADQPEMDHRSTCRVVSQSLGMSQETVHLWVKKADAGNTPRKKNSQPVEAPSRPLRRR
jgi:transposase-like protein